MNPPEVVKHMSLNTQGALDYPMPNINNQVIVMDNLDGKFMD